MTFAELVASLPQTGLDWHRETILENSRRNAEHVVYTIRDLPRRPAPCLVISAGPSLVRERILARIPKGFKGTIVAADGAYIQCLKAGIVPDFVMTLDPHPTRVVRWFGDPHLDLNSEQDDYFQRQDLDVSFRANSAAENARNIALVDANRAARVISSTSPANVVQRTALHPKFWFSPLVDSPVDGSLTKQMVEITGLPALNTGGTVGTAAWVFAHAILQSEKIAVVGMDFGYYPHTPLKQTQSWHMLGGDLQYYPASMGHWGAAFTDPTYAWYLQNMLDLLKAADARIVNCSGAGLLQGDRVDCMELEDWLSSFS